MLAQRNLGVIGQDWMERMMDIQQNAVTISGCQEGVLDLTALCAMSSITREQDLAANLPSNATISCLSLSSNNSPVLMDVYQSGPFGDATTLGLLTGAAPSSSCIQTGDINNIAPLATPLFQLPTPAVINSFSDKPLEKPRLPVSSYAYFIQERREMYRRLGTAVKFTDFSKECSEVWGQMRNEEKERFKELSSQDKMRYQKEMDHYKRSTEVKVKKRGRKKRQPGHPKRNMSAFLFFSAEKRPQLKSTNPKATVGDNSKQLSNEWKQMTDEEKEPYIKMAYRDKERYSQQKVAFSNDSKPSYHAGVQGDNLPFALTEDIENFNKKKDSGMPKRNMSAFMFFSCAKRPEFKKSNPGASLSTLSKMLSEAWKKLTPPQRNTYETMATNDKERYRQQIASYKRGIVKV